MNTKQMKQTIEIMMAQAEALTVAVRLGNAEPGDQDEIESLSDQIEVLSDQLFAALRAERSAP